MLKKFLITIIVFSILAIGVNDYQLAFAGANPCSPESPDSDGDGVCDAADPEPFNPCFPDRNSSACAPVGGEILPIDSTALLLAGVQANYSILIALAVVGIGASFAALNLKRK